jgi:hypothetical protein
MYCNLALNKSDVPMREEYSCFRKTIDQESVNTTGVEISSICMWLIHPADIPHASNSIEDENSQRVVRFWKLFSIPRDFSTPSKSSLPMQCFQS